MPATAGIGQLDLERFAPGPRAIRDVWRGHPAS
jgi:hypothetical protein